jgi:Protein of unknown function (DUF3102)
MEQPPEQSSTPRREVRTRTRALSTDDLARQIEIEHRAFVDAATNAMERAVRCGQLLLQAKARVDHGDWLDWIDDHLSFGARQAQKYMSYAEHPEVLANANSNAYLTIDGAMALIAAQRRETPAEPPATNDRAVLARVAPTAARTASPSRALTRSAAPDHLARLQSALGIFAELPEPPVLAPLITRSQVATLRPDMVAVAQYLNRVVFELDGLGEQR